MSQPHAFWWRLSLLALTAVLLAGPPSLCPAPRAAWAQDEDEEEAEEEAGEGAAAKAEEKKPPKYVAPYALVIVCVGVGVWLICRPSRRAGPKQTAWLPSITGKEGTEAGQKKGHVPRGKELCQEAKTGLNMAIAGIIPFVGILGIWKSVQAKKLISQNRRLTGEGRALAGIIVGTVTVVIWVVVVVVVLAKVLSGGGEG